MTQCGRLGCKNLSSKTCSSCMIEKYCSCECQRGDWKSHKVICLFMKDNNNLLPFEKVIDVVNKLNKYTKVKEDIYCKDKMDKDKEKNGKISEFCLSFAERQFGDIAIGKNYREREDKTNILNRNVDFDFIIPMYIYIIELYFPNEYDAAKYDIDIFVINKSIHYLKKFVSVLEYWQKQYDLTGSEQAEHVSNDTIDFVYGNISNANMKLAVCCQRLEDLDNVVKHSIQAIHYARKIIICKKRVVFLQQALLIYGEYLTKHKKNTDARCMFEEAYNIMIDVYPVDHPRVLHSAGSLVHFLIVNRDYIDAERFARISYQCLSKSGTIESESVANFAMYLAIATFELISLNIVDSVDVCMIGNIEEVEMLLRKSIRINEKINGYNHYSIIDGLITLSNVLRFIYKNNESDSLLLRVSTIIENRTNSNDPNISRINYFITS